MKRTVVMKALLLALTVGLAYADVDPAQISGPWRTFAIVADNMEMIQEGGPHRMLLRHVECDTGCNALNVFFSVRRNRVCTPHMVVAQKNEDGVYTADFEGQNYFQLVGRDPDSLVFINYNVSPDGTTTRLSLLAARVKIIHTEELGHFVELTEEHGIPRENILYMDDTDTCPP